GDRYRGRGQVWVARAGAYARRARASAARPLRCGGRADARDLRFRERLDQYSAAVRGTGTQFRKSVKLCPPSQCDQNRLANDAPLFVGGAFLNSLFANHLVLIGALVVFAFAAFALHVNLDAGPESTAAVAQSVK